MTFTRHFFFFGLAHWRILLAGGSLALFLVLLWGLPYAGPDGAVPAEGTARPATPMMDLGALRQHAAIFRAVVQPAAVDDAVIWEDFRFAGTFSLYDPADPDEASLRRAVVSYRPEQRQYIVSEGDRVGGADVIRISAQELVLRVGDQDGVLQLGGARGATEGRAQDGAADRAGPVDVAQTRFGEQTRPGTWRMDRDALLAYYEELLDDPERLLQVFDSMQPIYTPDGEIEGYALQAVGEAEFFAAVGFEEGDTVRAVNTLPMTNRRRAEFFIGQVVENDLSAIVIDIERDGTEQRLVYELR